MEKQEAVRSLAALAHETRLDIFRMLVREGMQAIPAGTIAQALGVPAATLSFHLATLKQAGLLRSHREGRSILYRADFGAMGAMLAYLTENCCVGSGPSVVQVARTGTGGPGPDG